MIRLYLDNCCYNRPYDDQTQIRINLETQAKLYLQEMIRDKKVELVTSYVLDYENSRSRYDIQRKAIKRFMDENSTIYVGAGRVQEAENIAKEIQKTGVKEKDSLHLACAIIAECDYFISTDDRLLKYTSDKMQLLTPTEFIRRLEEL